MRYAIRTFEEIGSQSTVILRILLWFIVIVIPIFCLGCDGLQMRKEIPFQEVVPLDRGIAVINAGRWYQDKLEISLAREGGKTQRKFYDKKGICVFGDLTNGAEYTVEIRRTDLKGMVLYKPLRENVQPVAGGTKYVVLVGASVGKAWKFEKLTERLHIKDGLVLGNRTKYDFDKNSEIENIVESPVPIYGAIVKECAAYFPRDLASSQEMIKGWVRKLAMRGVKPILATVVPVTAEHDRKHPGKFNSITKFNDFIREYSLKEGIQVLDLEEALRIGDGDRHLRAEYAAPDGLHLVKKAYHEKLDGIALSILEIGIPQKADIQEESK